MKTLHTRRWLVLAALLALVLAVALCACSGQEPSKEADTPVETATPTPTPTATPEPTATPTPTPTPTPEPTVEPTPEATPEPTDDNAELVALKNGEVNANDNLTSSANESNKGKTEGNSASTKKPNAPVVQAPAQPSDAPIKNYDPETAGEGEGWMPSVKEDINTDGPGAVEHTYTDEEMELILSGDSAGFCS